MVLRDKLLRCSEYGAEFVFGVDEQRAMMQNGVIVEPHLCSACELEGGTQVRLSGYVKWFDQRRGYGFITRMMAAGMSLFTTPTSRPMALRCSKRERK